MIPMINTEPKRGATTINRSRYRVFVHIGFRLVSSRFKRDQTLSSCTSSRRFAILLWLAVRSCSFPRQFNSAKESKLLPLIFRISRDERSFCFCVASSSGIVLTECHRQALQCSWLENEFFTFGQSLILDIDLCESRTSFETFEYLDLIATEV